MDPDVVDEWIRVSDRDSFLIARRLAHEEGILAGGSGGTSVWAAMQIAKRLGPGARVLTMIPDSGRNYLSKLYDDNWMLEHGFAERPSRPAGASRCGSHARRARAPARQFGRRRSAALRRVGGARARTGARAAAASGRRPARHERRSRRRGSANPRSVRRVRAGRSSPALGTRR